MNFDNIANLAKTKSAPTDEFRMENINDSVKEALVELLAVEKKTVAKEAAQDIISILRSASAKELALVEEIRAIRRKETELKGVLVKIKNARDFAQTSANYMVLADAVGLHIPSIHRRLNPELFIIPSVTAASKEE